jgi:hypothetical protein
LEKKVLGRTSEIRRAGAFHSKLEDEPPEFCLEVTSPPVESDCLLSQKLGPPKLGEFVEMLKQHENIQQTRLRRKTSE